jgi:hypothetical protein
VRSAFGDASNCRPKDACPSTSPSFTGTQADHSLAHAHVHQHGGCVHTTRVSPHSSLQDDKVDGHVHRISRVEPGGPAEVAGIKKGDRVISVNGVMVAGEVHEFALAAFGMSLDDTVAVSVEEDPSKIESLDALKPPIPLVERKSSHNLLATQTSSGASPTKVSERVCVITHCARRIDTLSPCLHTSPLPPRVVVSLHSTQQSSPRGVTSTILASTSPLH